MRSAAIRLRASSALATVYLVVLGVGGWYVWQWLQAEPDPYAFHRALSTATWAVSTDRTELAKQTLDSMATVAPDEQSAYRVGLMYQRLGDSANAKTMFEKALALNPAYWDPHYQLGILAITEERFDEALVELQEVVRLNPDWGAAYFFQGRALEGLGRLYEALAMYTKAPVAKVPFSDGNAAVRSLVGRLDPEQARKLIEQAAARENSGALYYMQADMLLSKGDLAGAIAPLQDAIRLSPTMWEPYARLGGVMVALKRDQEAIPALRKALELQPKYAPTYFQLGLALERQGDPKGAGQAYLQAKSLDPNIDGLAAALKRLGL